MKREHRKSGKNLDLEAGPLPWYTRPDGSIVCPYCYENFASTVKYEVLEDILNAPHTKVGGRREWEW